MCSFDSARNRIIAFGAAGRWDPIIQPWTGRRRTRDRSIAISMILARALTSSRSDSGSGQFILGLLASHGTGAGGGPGPALYLIIMAPPIETCNSKPVDLTRDRAIYTKHVTARAGRRRRRTEPLYAFHPAGSCTCVGSPSTLQLAFHRSSASLRSYDCLDEGTTNVPALSIDPVSARSG